MRCKLLCSLLGLMVFMAGPALAQDFSVTAPYAGPTAPMRTTCGAGDDCALKDTEDHTYEVAIPHDSDWTFSLCGSTFDTYMFLGTTLCGEEVGYNDDFCGVQSELTVTITAGTYYVDVEGYSDCGDYVLNVFDALAPPTGACCVASVCVATNTESECDALTGDWYEGEDCATFVCPGSCPEDTLRIEIFTDEYASETTWDLYEQGGGEIASGDPGNNNALHTWDVCLETAKCYDFTIYDSYGDGICCSYGDGYYELYLNDVLVASNYAFSGDFDTVAVGGGCGEPVGRCCYGDPSAPDCADNTEAECAALVGTWDYGLNCTDDPCPVLPPNDTCAGAAPAACDYTVLPGEDTTNAVNDYWDTSGCTGFSSNGKDLTYELTLTETKDVTVTMDPTPYVSFDASVYLVTDCADIPGTCLAGADSGNPETFTVTLEAGTYYIIADAYSTGEGLFDLTIECETTPVGGACCLPDGSCVQTADETACVALYGVYQGDGSDCATTDCPQLPDPSLQLIPDADCYEAGDVVCVDIWMIDILENVVGGQFFLNYDTAYLTLPTGDAGAIVPGDAPMSIQVYECSVAQTTGGVCTPTAGEIGYAVGVPTDPPNLSVTGDWKMATICFTAAQDICSVSDLMTWWMDAGGQTRMTTSPFDLIYPDLEVLNIADTTPPTVTPPDVVELECSSELPDAATTITEFNSLAGADAYDNCTATCSLTVTSVTYILDGDECEGTITRTYTITDHCLNSTAVDHVFNVSDDTPPTITYCPPDTTVECDGSGNTLELDAWLASFAASDNCVGVTLSNNFTGLSDECGETGSATVTFTAEDECDNVSTCQATFTIEDTAPPVITGCPGDIEVNADAGSCSAVVTWIEPTVDDDCGMGTFVSTHSPGETFPQGVTTVTYTATDDCDNVTLCIFDVTVLAFNDLLVSVELQGIETAVTRCIKFTFTKCAPPNSVTIYRDLDFDAGGLAMGVLFEDLPCGDYECVTAEDMLHTLQVRLDSVPDFDIVGTQYVAYFTGDNRLTTADYYNDELIDIADFGAFITEWGACYDSEPDSICDGHTPCAYAPPSGFHADANGDGVLDVSDFNPISGNFLMTGDPDCCSRGGGGDQPRDAVTVQELLDLGVRNARRADLNGDGWIDMADVELFLNGGVPDDAPALAPSEPMWLPAEALKVRP